MAALPPGWTSDLGCSLVPGPSPVAPGVEHPTGLGLCVCEQPARLLKGNLCYNLFHKGEQLGLAFFNLVTHF